MKVSILRSIGFLLLAIAAAGQTIVTVKQQGDGNYSDLQSAIDYCALQNEDSNGCIIEVDAHGDRPFEQASSTRISFKEQRTPGEKWITIRSSRISELPPDRRVRPEDAYLMPKFSATSTDPVMRFEAKAKYYRLEGLEIFADNRRTQNLIEIGLNSFANIEDLPEHIILDRLYIHGPELKNTVLKDGIKADGREVQIINCYIHRIQNTNGQETHAISLTNGAGPLLVRNNRIEALSIGSLMGGFPAAVRGLVPADSKWLGNHYSKDIRWKSLWIRNEPAGNCVPGEWRRSTGNDPDTLWECRDLSGTPTWVFVGTTVTDKIDPSGDCVSGSHWRNSDSNSYWDCIDGGWRKTDNSHTWTGGASEFGGEEKNLWECKSCSGSLVEGNVLENAWGPGGGSQWGSAFLFNSSDSSREQARWSRAENVVVRNNWTRNHGPIATFGYLGPDRFYDDPYRIHHIVFENNLSENAMGPLWQLTLPGAGGNRWLWLGGAHFLRVVNNTMIGTQTRENGSFGNGLTIDLDRTFTGTTWLNNIFPAGEAGFRSGSALPGTQTLSKFWPEGDYRYNVMVKDVASSWVPNWYATRQNNIDPCCFEWGLPPSPDRFVSWLDSWNKVGFVNFNRGMTDPERGAGAKRLCTGGGTPDAACLGASSYLVSPVDGRPAGANIDAIEWATAGAISGQDNPWFDFQIRTAHPSTGIVYTAYSPERCRVTVSNDFNHTSVVYDAEDLGGDRDRSLTVGPVGSEAVVQLPDARSYYVKITCEGGRFRETELRNF